MSIINEIVGLEGLLMFKRVVTAIVILVVLLPIIYISPLAFKLMGIVLTFLATQELLGVRKEKNYSKISIGLIYSMNILPLLLINDFTYINAVYIAIIYLVFHLILIFDKNINYTEFSYVIAFSMFIILASNAAMYLRGLDNGFYLVIFTILVTAASDTGGFFAGNAFGKHKLIERISPKKTIEGLIGGVIASLVIGLIFGMVILDIGIDNPLYIALISIIMGFTASFGDLIFSAIKRTYQVKDFSNILPGHGGILDRIDSHLTNLLICFIIVVLMKG